MEIFIASILAFVSTNIDDIFILILFFGNKKFKSGEIVIGQFLGIIALIGVSLLGSLIGLILQEAYIGLLGLIPFYLGIMGILTILKKEKQDAEDPHLQTNKSNILSVAGTTFANGGDNIGIYVPLFATLTWGGKISMITIFLIMTFVWCMMARYFTKHPYLAKAVDKYGHIITPIVLVFLGLYIMFEAGSFGLISI
jgi:cadmium resistance transport/sequestration family protein